MNTRWSLVLLSYFHRDRLMVAAKHVYADSLFLFFLLHKTWFYRAINCLTVYICYQNFCKVCKRSIGSRLSCTVLLCLIREELCICLFLYFWHIAMLRTRHCFSFWRSALQVFMTLILYLIVPAHPYRSSLHWWAFHYIEMTTLSDVWLLGGQCAAMFPCEHVFTCMCFLS